MSGTAVVLAFVVVAGVAAPLVLYRLVRAEHDDRAVMDREAAERVARRDVDERDRR